MSNSEYKVSLIMPNYNYGHYLHDSLEGVLNQTYKNFELILIDDASTDNSLEIIEPYLQKFPQITLLKHKKNKGFFSSVEEGLEIAKGHYVTFPSSDDILFPNFLEEKVRVLEAYPQIGLCCSRFSTFLSQNPSSLHTTSLQKSYPEMKLSGDELATQIKKFRFWIAGNTTLCRKNLFIENGGFDPKYLSFTDWFVFSRIGFQHGAYFIPKTLAALRVHSNSLSATVPIRKKEQAWREILKVLSKPQHKALKSAFIRSHIFHTFGFEFYDFIIKNPKYWLFFKFRTYKQIYSKWKIEKLKFSLDPIPFSTETDKDSPQISILMPNFNHANYICRAIEGVAKQTFTDFELIFIDDGSTDNSLEVLKPYLSQFSWIRLKINKKNLGIAESLELGLKLARGKYIAHATVDDVLFPDFLKRHVNVFKDNPNVGLVCSNHAYFQLDNLSDIQTVSLLETNRPIWLSPKMLVEKIQSENFWIPGNAALIRKDVFEKNGGYSPKSFSRPDWFGCLKVAFLYGIYFIPETLVATKKHPIYESTVDKFEVWDRMIEYLSKPSKRYYKDKFLRSDSFKQFDAEFFDFMLTHPRYWNFFKHHLWLSLFKKWIKKRFAPKLTQKK